MLPTLRHVLTPRWNPLQLGADLLAWWSADRNDSIIRTGGTPIVSWVDVKNGYVATQGVSGSRPAYSPTGFGGFPCIVFDGTDDELTVASCPLPTGATPAEVWAVANQSALVADTGTRQLLSYGGTSNATRRALLRRVVSAANRASLDVGDNSVAQAVNDTAVDFSGRHFARGVFGATASTLQVDGNATITSTSVVPVTGSTRVRIGASSANTAANFWNGSVRDIVVTNALSVAQAALMAAWAEQQVARGIA